MGETLSIPDIFISWNKHTAGLLAFYWKDMRSFSCRDSIANHLACHAERSEESALWQGRKATCGFFAALSMTLSTVVGNSHRGTALLMENLLQGRLNEAGWDGEAESAGGCVGLGVDGGQGWDADELPL